MILNEYFSLVVDAVHQHQGVLDKFVGDEAMAVFGLGNELNPCELAVHTAIDIRTALAVMNETRRQRSAPTIDTGVGIHYGPAIAGNIGSRERLEYTVIGDTVNTAARLESLTKTVKVPICFSAAVYEQLDEETRKNARTLGEHELKGKAAATATYGLNL